MFSLCFGWSCVCITMFEGDVQQACRTCPASCWSKLNGLKLFGLDYTICLKKQTACLHKKWLNYFNSFKPGQVKPITLFLRIMDLCNLLLFFTADHLVKACKGEYCYIFHLTLLTLRKGKERRRYLFIWEKLTFRSDYRG